MATKTLDQIAELAKVYRTARGEFSAHYQTKPEPFDFDSEDHMRWKWRNDRLCTAVVKAQEPYREACDEFFAKSCPDLIQLLVEVDEHFDGQEDVDDGIPNTAMRIRQQVEAFIGPAPVPQAEAAQ